MGSNNIEDNSVVQKAKGYADLLGNNNDKIDTAEEIIIFQKTLQTAHVDGKLSDKDFNEAMGLYTTQVETTVPAEAEKEAETEVPAEVVKNEEAVTPTTPGLTEDEIKLIGQAVEETGINEPYANANSVKAFREKVVALYKEGKISNNAMMMINQIHASEYQDAFNQILLKKEYLELNDATKEFNSARKKVLESWEEPENQTVKRRELKKEAIKEAGNTHMIRKASRQRNVQIQTAIAATGKTVEFHSIQTKEQLEAVLKDEGRINLDRLIESGAIKENDDGTYDLSALIEQVVYGVGFDLSATRTHKDIKNETGEFEQTRRLVGGNFGYNDNTEGPLTNKELKTIFKLVGIPIDGKDWVKALLHAVGGFAAGYGAGAAAAATNPDQSFWGQDVTTDASTYVKLNVSEGITLDNMNLLSEGVLSQVGSQILINVPKIVTAPGTFYEISKFIDRTALKVGVVGAVAGLIEGLQDDPEIPVASVHGETYTELCDNLASAGKKAPVRNYKTAIELIALLYRNEDDTLKPEFYELFKSKVGGENGVINKKEFLGLLLALENGTIEVPKQVNTNPDKKVDIKKDQIYRSEETITITDAERKYIGNSNWQKLVEQYPCLNDFGYKKASRILKLVQAVKDPSLYNAMKDDGGYLLAHLADISLKSDASQNGLKLELQKLGIADKIDFDVFMDFYKNALDQNSYGKFPEVLMDCRRKDIDLKVSKQSGTSKGASTLADGNSEYIVYKVLFSDGTSYESQKAADCDAKIAEYQEAHKDVTYTVTEMNISEFNQKEKELAQKDE